MVLLADVAGVADWNRGLDDHDGLLVLWFPGVCGEDEFDDGFYGGGVKEVLVRIVIRWSDDNDEIGGLIGHEGWVRGCGFLSVQDGVEIKGSLVVLRFGKVGFDIFVLNRGLVGVQLVDLLWDDIDGGYLIVLG